jgi:uncharacterized protein
MRAINFAELDSRIRRGPTGRIVVYLAVILCLMAIPFLITSHLRVLENNVRLNECIFEAIFAASAVIAVFLMRKGPDPHPVSDYGLTFKGIISLTALGAGIGLAVMSCLMNVLRVLHIYTITDTHKHFSPLPSAVLFLFVAIAEETIFRGFIFNTIEHKAGSLVAIVATSLVFGLAHLVDYIPGVPFGEHFRAALFIAVEVGLLLNAAFMVTRSLWLNIGIHWAWNFFEGPYYGTNVSGSPDSSTYYVSHMTGSQLVTGGLFGPEASIYCLLICTAAGLLMLIAAIRRGQWRPNPELMLAMPTGTSARQTKIPVE